MTTTARFTHITLFEICLVDNCLGYTRILEDVLPKVCVHLENIVAGASWLCAIWRAIRSTASTLLLYLGHLFTVSIVQADLGAICSFAQRVEENDFESSRSMFLCGPVGVLSSYVVDLNDAQPKDGRTARYARIA